MHIYKLVDSSNLDQIKVFLVVFEKAEVYQVIQKSKDNP